MRHVPQRDQQEQQTNDQKRRQNSGSSQSLMNKAQNKQANRTQDSQQRDQCPSRNDHC